MLKKGLMSPCAQAQLAGPSGSRRGTHLIHHYIFHLSLRHFFFFCPSAFPLLWLMLRPLSSPLLACQVCVCPVKSKKELFLEMYFCVFYSTPKLFLSSLGVLGPHWLVVKSSSRDIIFHPFCQFVWHFSLFLWKSKSLHFFFFVNLVALEPDSGRFKTGYYSAFCMTYEDHENP
ncbi:hypothetical protein B0T09DRAFT_81351 [Sordaria sp. MPI-SDFR-AT-0083]|nr:hypothetical protein B0T09DRAFT_81351 [Sordaria sp. MPI-SDFR-AT-0083]